MPMVTTVIATIGRHKGKDKHTANSERPESSHRAGDRDKGLRSSKGDPKGNGRYVKSSTSWIPDAKGKGGEVNIQLDHLPTADDDEIFDIQMSLQDDAKFYLSGPMGGASSSTAVTDPRYHAAGKILSPISVLRKY
jgi:hypothetical protein